jgi:rubrerythrin
MASCNERMEAKAMAATGSNDKVAEQLSVLQAAVEIEEFGIRFYQRLEECIAETEGKALMRSLAHDEASHKEIILREMGKLQAAGSHIVADRRYADIVPEKVFASLPQDRCLTVKEQIEVLEVGMDVERRSIEMYNKAATAAMDAEVRGVLERLVHIEEGHLKLLEDGAYNLRMEGSWYGYSPLLEG